METKSVRLDLRCEGDDGTRFIVEMQQSGQRHFFRASGTFSRGVDLNGQAVTYPNTLSGKNRREKYLMKVFR